VCGFFFSILSLGLRIATAARAPRGSHLDGCVSFGRMQWHPCRRDAFAPRPVCGCTLHAAAFLSSNLRSPGLHCVRAACTRRITVYDFDRLDADDALGNLELDMWKIFDKQWGQEIDQSFPLNDDYGDVGKKILKKVAEDKEHVRL
jgi:hypothetical protein